MIYGRNHPCGTNTVMNWTFHATCRSLGLKSGVMHLTCPSIIRVYDSDRSNDAVLGRPIFARLLFLRFEVQKRAPSLSYCFAPISIALRPSRPAAKPALTCFVLISMVLRHWSSRLALRPASNFVSSYNFLVCCNFHNLEALRLALRRPFAPAAA